MHQLNCGFSSQYLLSTALEHLRKKVAKLLAVLTPEQDGIGICSILHLADIESMFLPSIYRSYAKNI